MGDSVSDKSLFSGRWGTAEGWLLVKKKTPCHVVWAEMGFGLHSKAGADQT